MSHHPDFEELLSALSAERVRYLIVGAYAVMKYTEPRYTKDLDVWVGTSASNAKKVYRALERFGAPLNNVRVEDFETPGIVFQIGVEPVRIDVITQVDGLDFDKVWERRVRGKYGSVPVAFLAVRDLVTNKKLVARPQDLLDIAKLRGVLPAKRSAKRPRPTSKPQRRRGRR